MSERENIEVYRHVFDAVNRADLGALDHLIMEDLLDHNAIDDAPGLAGFKGWVGFMHKLFSGANATVEDALGQGDKVAGRVTWRGKHAAAFRGIPPTGKAVEFTAIHIVRLENGKIAEWWGVPDIAGLMEQISGGS